MYSVSAIHVHLLTENRLLRDTLAKLLRKRVEIAAVQGSTPSENSKVEIINSKCDLVLTDCFGVKAGGGFLHDLLEQAPGIKLLLFGMTEEVDLFLRAVHLGISGYLLKEASAAEIVAAVNAAVRGQASCPASLCMALFQYVSRNKSEKMEMLGLSSSSRRSLTARQLQLIRLVATGLTNKEIAANLNLSEFTIKNHIRRIMKQMEAENRHEAVALVRASGNFIPV